VVFSSHLWQKNLATVQQRREATQELLSALDRWGATRGVCFKGGGGAFKIAGGAGQHGSGGQHVKVLLC